MKTIVTALILFLGISNLSAQENTIFPPMDCENLNNKLLSLPDAIMGKYSILGLAFSKKSENDLNSWFQPMYNQFIYKPETPSLFAGNYDVNNYFIPMFTGVKRPAYKKVMEKVKKNIDPKLHEYVLFYQGTLKEYKKTLNFDEGKDVPYFFVLDPEGKVIFATNGKYSDKKMQAIVDAVAESFN